MSSKIFHCVLLLLLIALLSISGCGGGSGSSQSATTTGGESAFTVSGLITEIDGITPVAGATCTLEEIQAGSANRAYSQSTTTGNKGRYTFGGVTTGYYQLIVSSGETVKVTVFLTVTGNVTDEDVQVLQTGQWDDFMGDSGHSYDPASGYMIIRAHTQSADGIRSPLSGVEISCMPATYESRGYINSGVVDWNASCTYEDGNAFFYKVSTAQTYTITGRKQGYIFQDISGAAPIAGEIVEYHLGTVPQNAELTSISVTPEEVSVTKGTSQQFIATGSFNNGMTLDITSQAAWSCDNGQAGAIDAMGVFTAASSGSFPQQAHINASLNGITSNESAVTVTTDAPDHLSFATQPSNGTAGSAITPAVKVEILDASGNRITSATNDITMSIDNNPGSAALSGTLTVAAVSGVATFSDLSLNKQGSGYTLKAACSGPISQISDAFNVAGPGIDSISPSSGIAGVEVTITGTVFGSAQGTVKFNGISATITSWSSTEVKCKVPAGIATGNVVVTAGGIDSNGKAFTKLFHVLVTSHSGGWVKAVRTSDNNVSAPINVTAPYGVAVTPDGTRAYGCNYIFAGTAKVINTLTNLVVTTISALGEYPRCAVVRPDGTRVYMGIEDSNNVKVIDTSDNSIAATVGVGTAPIGIAVKPDGTRVYVANRHSDNVSVIDTSNNSIAATIYMGLDTEPYDVAVTPDGLTAYVTDYGKGKVTAINTVTNGFITIGVGTGPTGVAISPDGSKAYVSNYGSDTVSVIDTATNTVIQTVAGVNDGEDMVMVPDGSAVYVTNYLANNIWAINTTTYAVTSVPVGATTLGTTVTP